MALWSSHAFLYSLTLSLLQSLWQGTVFGLAGLALHSRLKRVTPDVRCGSYSLLLVAFFAVWLGTFCCLYDKAVQPVSASASAFVETGYLSQPILSSALEGSPAPPILPQSFWSWLLTGWALGVCALSLRHLGGFLFLCCLCRTHLAPCLPVWETSAAQIAARMGLRRKFVLRCSTQIDIPCVFGIGKSFILLPFSVMLRLPTEQVEALIAHELAHIARQDAFFNLVQVCMETLLFYHPAVWWLSRQIRVAREQGCDDLAVQAIGDRALYAHALYSLEEARATIPQLALGAKGDNSKMMNGQLLPRIQRVLGVCVPEKRAPWAKGILALCTASLGLAVMMPVQAYSHNNQPKTKSKSPAARRTKQEPTVKIVTKILLNINGDKIELNTTNLQPDTPVTVNGKEGRFGDLNPTQQQQLRDAVAKIPELPSSLEGGDARVVRIIKKDGDNSKSVKVIKNSSRTRILLNINGDKIELNTKDLQPNTPVRVNGKLGRFSDLTPLQQQQLRSAVAKIPTRPSLEISEKVGEAIKSLELSDEVRQDILEKLHEN